ncbi:L10-interacting MYB domain-containing protein-like [Phalaenopsis equestris]|uniref:L10-interacting MYB domain-containing protein-like n=1 Tax=Phalaenopsis equestris TaxID=78828 RepID=UPI0009E296C2|nr:L10-interacting MYB domain-containing protein-like [Phalaenopsis equestris]
MGKTSEGGPSAMWDKEVTNIFCDLCLKEIEPRSRPTTYFNKEGWNNIGMRFKELTGRDYDKLKFKNKWDQLKKEWKIWKELKRGSTDLGWDPIKRTIDAPTEWWTEKLEQKGMPDEFTPEPLTPDEDVCSINQRDTRDSSTIKRPKVAKKNKEKKHVLNTSFDRLIEAFADLPISDASILTV